MCYEREVLIIICSQNQSRSCSISRHSAEVYRMRRKHSGIPLSGDSKLADATNDQRKFIVLGAIKSWHIDVYQNPHSLK